MVDLFTTASLDSCQFIFHLSWIFALKGECLSMPTEFFVWYLYLHLIHSDPQGEQCIGFSFSHDYTESSLLATVGRALGSSHFLVKVLYKIPLCLNTIVQPCVCFHHVHWTFMVEDCLAYPQREKLIFEIFRSYLPGCWSSVNTFANKSTRFWHYHFQLVENIFISCLDKLLLTFSHISNIFGL